MYGAYPTKKMGRFVFIELPSLCLDSRSCRMTLTPPYNLSPHTMGSLHNFAMIRFNTGVSNRYWSKGLPSAIREPHVVEVKAYLD